LSSRPQTIGLPPRPGFGPRALTRAAWNSNPRINTSLIRGGFTMLALLCDVGALGIAAAVTRVLSTHLPHMEEAARAALPLTSVVTIFFLASNMMRSEYKIAHYLAHKDSIRRIFLPWNIAFLCAIIICFWMRETIGFSISEAVVFYGIGLGLIALARMLLVRWTRMRAEAGGIAERRVLLIGYEDEVTQFSTHYEPWRLGMHVAAASVLRGTHHLKEDLALASAHARILRPDDIFILVPWSHKETIDACINAFLRVPAAIHLGPERVLDRFADAQVCKIGPIASLNLVHRPLSTAEVLTKRSLDVAMAGTALLLLAPVFLVLAIAIKCDSPGPVIFRQRRYGFNQEPFRIFKFRTMHALEDGASLKQATRNDSRVTRLGRFMRRLNIDELPQLLNVLRGEMSLVGPRPHALAHDQLFEPFIGLYARRHNVKPGITGWAQVNGFRGPFSDEKIRQRIAYDLYYIDNWSLLFDIQILWLTVTSKKAYRNAY
jgi:putative colanic acid biosynthesis UDP-glucose lipid carrier transferase